MDISQKFERWWDNVRAKAADGSDYTDFNDAYHDIAANEGLPPEQAWDKLKGITKRSWLDLLHIQENSQPE